MGLAVLTAVGEVLACIGWLHVWIAERMKGRMTNRCRLIEAYALQTDFEMGGRRGHAVYVHQCREGCLHSAIFVSSVGSYPVCLNQEPYSRSSRKTQQGIWIEPHFANGCGYSI